MSRFAWFLTAALAIGIVAWEPAASFTLAAMKHDLQAASDPQWLLHGFARRWLGGDESTRLLRRSALVATVAALLPAALVCWSFAMALIRERRLRSDQ